MNCKRESRQALKRARAALDSNNDENLEYAALELRMAMESLTYDRAKAFKDEFPPDEYETWQPRKVMAVLLEIDATANKDSTLSYGIEETPGQPASQMTMIGTETVLNMETLCRHYDALGSFLHVPTLKQTKSGKGHDQGKLRMRCTEIVKYIDPLIHQKKQMTFDNILGPWSGHADSNRLRVGWRNSIGRPGYLMGLLDQVDFLFGHPRHRRSVQRHPVTLSYRRPLT